MSSLINYLTINGNLIKKIKIKSATKWKRKKGLYSDFIRGHHHHHNGMYGWWYSVNDDDDNDSNEREEAKKIMEWKWNIFTKILSQI